jgi:hypothetical protein
MKDDVLTPLKNPEFNVRVISYAFGAKPKAEPKMAQVTLEEALAV